MRAEACNRCGRTVGDLRRALSIEQLRGAAPLCSVPGCPLVQKIQGFAKPPEVRGKEIFGPSPPSVFVGRFGYPHVSLGPLLPPGAVEKPALLDSPRDWTGSDILSILGLRSRLLRSKTVLEVDAVRDPSRSLEVSRELAMATKPVETEITLSKEPKLDFTPRLEGLTPPMGPSVDVVKTRITEHVAVPRKVDQIVSDTDVLAAEGAWEMYRGGVDPYQIQKIFSVGLLGERHHRKLVPTRWSITATDDVLGKQLIERIKNFQQVGGIEYHSSELFGNHFHVLFFPQAWRYEMVETWLQGDDWNANSVTVTDAEGFRGRTDYASAITGAYYAARLSCLEHLVERQRQAALLVVREITDDYWAPLGVWVIREGVRMALETPALAFGEAAAAIKHVTRRVRAKGWSARSQLARDLVQQRTLKDFFRSEDGPEP
ncbi:MAG TPA: Nre family DNA repair protein [Candidatus Thermoplasmatota archaeon]|nr:Nre family DNA repair protein [Candidatus Thermoplasmatota archaeon]